MKSYADDRIPSDEKLQKIFLYPDRRIKAIVDTLTSSGIRLGAWDCLRWGNIKLIEKERLGVVAAKTIYMLVEMKNILHLSHDSNFYNRPYMYEFPNLFTKKGKYHNYYNYYISEIFIQSAEHYFVDGKDDTKHHPMYKICLIRIPGTYNSKCLVRGKSLDESKAKLIQKWDGIRINAD